ncbi:hypothetical protein ACQ4PT_030295 [Festuca glaucescens]
MVVSKQWTRVRTLGRGASGAEVFLAADDASGELFAVKSACASGALALRREQALFLEFAPGGSLADEVARSGGSLDECAIRRYAADVATGLAYLHGAGTVHGDVKARNIVIGADGRAKLADLGCARKSSASGKIIGGTPAFMAPEVARGEEQGPAADVWALGCTVVEMATGRAPWERHGWRRARGDALDRVHGRRARGTPMVVRGGEDFLAGCLIRDPIQRCTAAQLLQHPFLASAAGVDSKLKKM